MCSTNVVNMSNLKGIYRTDWVGEPNLKVIKSNIVSLVYFEKGVACGVKITCMSCLLLCHLECVVYLLLWVV